jgi:tripartite-type tricarboxylate transporter receptor subunit TctC
MVVPYAAGGNTDVVARITALRLSAVLGQPVLVENRPGAGGTVGTGFVAKAAPDGYTIIMAAIGPIVIAPFVQKIPYDPVRDLVPVSNVSTNPLVLTVPPLLPARSVKELIELARARPGKLNFSSAGVGGLTHLCAEIFRHRAKIDIVHVPFKGGHPATVAAVAGEVQMTFANYSDAISQLKGGKLSALGITSAARQAQTPEVPTIAESGLPGFECVSWNGVLAPAGTPPEIVSRLSRAIQEIAREPDVRQRFTDIGSAAVGDTPEVFHAFIQSQLQFWGKLVKDLGIKISE